jgi:hypothetical protein
MRSIAVSGILLVFGELLSAQVTMPLKGVPYSFTGQPRWLLDGPTGPITARSKDPDGPGPLVAPKATLDNIAWKATLDVANIILSQGYNQLGWTYSGDTVQVFATVCFADNSQTASCNAAKDMIDHVEGYVPFGVCVESQEKCGVGDYGVTSYGNIWVSGWTAAFALMHDQLTTTEKQNFAAKLLNDVSAWGGTNGNPSVSCTNTTTALNANVISVNGLTVTVDTPVFGTSVNVGDFLYTAVTGPGIPKVVAIIDSTHATINFTLGMSGPAYKWPGTFNVATDCGWLWASKHDVSYPYTLTKAGGTPAGATMYPTTGGIESGAPPSIYGASNLQYDDLWGTLQMLNVTFEDDVNASVRSIPEFTAAYNFWHDSVYYWAETQWTGFNSSGVGYGYGRAAMMVPGIAFMVQNQVTPSLPLLSGVWAKNVLPASYMNTFPGEAESVIQWGQLYASATPFDISNSQWLPLALRAFAGTPEAAYANYWMRNVLPSSALRFGTTPVPLFWTEANLNRYPPSNNPSSTGLLIQSWMYLFTDPADAATNLSLAPLQKGFNVTDTLQYPIGRFISRTSLTDSNATVAELYSDYIVNNENGDHFVEGAGNPASYKILTNNYLLSEDFPGANPAGLFDGGYTAGFTGAGFQSNYIQLGDDTTLSINNDGHGGTGEYVLLPRVYDSNNSAAYAMVDATRSYNNNPNHVYRHLMHLKKAGTQDFIVVYDDIQTPVGIKKTTFLHYANNGAAPRGTTTSRSGVVVSNYPGTGLGDASQLLTEVFSPAGPTSVVVVEDGAAYTGAGGNSYRFSICASSNGSTCDPSNTSAEFLVVHMPVLGTGNSLPAITDISNTSFAGLQIGGNSPKIALFPRNGQMYTSAVFTATHAGTAQIAVAGLRSGIYTVTRDGGAASTISVGADSVLYMEGPSGSYSVSTRPAAGFQLQAAAVQGGSLQ